MALSMTGCGGGTATDERANTCRVEVRCVNNRFLKVSFRAREGFALLESRVESAVRERIRRGAVQVSIDVVGPVAPASRSLDQAQLGAYLDQLEDFCAGHDLPVPKSIDGLLALPGILLESTPSTEAIDAAWPLVREALGLAIDGLERMRRAEGASMTRDMLATCDEIRGLTLGIGKRVPAVLEEHRQRLRDRIAKVLEQQGLTLSPADLAREIALLADRTDIAEELVRLESHLDQFARLLGEDSPGRSLDFLSQELAREANTIGSKSADVAIAHAVVEVKTRVERLRELVQNLE
jgi:uncharacterized protein (TIGR00255 family)